MMIDKKIAGQRIMPPADFPVSWENPDDAKLLWRLDGHVTTAIAPLSFSVTEAVLRGFGHAFEQLGLPLQARAVNINGYAYTAVLPGSVPPLPGQETSGLVDLASSGPGDGQLEKIEPILARLDAYWQDDLLPQNRQSLAFFENANRNEYDLPELRAHFDEALRQVESLGTLHARAAFPAIVAMSLFEELYCQLFPGETALDAFRLLLGFENQTVRGDRELWRLSRIAAATPAVGEILQQHEPERVMAVLAQSGDGMDFLAQTSAYLNQYGRRLNAFAQLSEPSWIEEPITAIACLQAYLKQPDSNPEIVRARLEAERDQALAEARRRLQSQPAAVVDRFESLLSAAQSATRIKEDNHWILQQLFYHMRRLALLLGKRMSATGRLAEAEDVFYLTAEELLADAVPGPAQLGERKAAKARFKQVTPPPVLGTVPVDGPAVDGPFSRAIRKAEATNSKPRQVQAQVVHGQAASAGLVRGTARVVNTLAEAHKLRPGEILVTKATTPPWTPLFKVAGAVVTDVGGILSHCAVVAREYGIPAVVGSGKATQTFRDGQLLEVNGTAGTVRVITS